MVESDPIQRIEIHIYLQIMTMLAVFDSIFVVSAVVGFSFPMLSRSWDTVSLKNLLKLIACFTFFTFACTS